MSTFNGSRSEFYGRAARLVSGLTLHQSALGVTHVNASVVLGALLDTRNKEHAYQTTRDGKQSALEAQTAAAGLAREFVAKARDVLRPFLGTQWTVGWAQAGFTRNTLSVPGSAPALVEVLGSLAAYFTAHAGQQSVALNVSAAQANALAANLQATIDTVAACRRDQRTRRDLRDAADGLLGSKLKASRSELDALLAPTDPRWLDLIGDIPGDPQRPEAVENVDAEPGAPGRVLVHWDAALRASSYEVETLVVGQGAEFTHAATVQGTMTELSFTPGLQVQVRVKARNAAGQSSPSNIAEVLVPLAQAA